MISPYQIETTTTKIQMFKSVAAGLLQAASSPLDIQLNRIIAKSSGNLSIINPEMIDYLYQTCNARTQSLEEMYKVLMSSIEMTIQWMNRCQNLQNSVIRVERQKQEEETKMKESIDDYTYSIRKLVHEKQELEIEINQIWGTKEHFKKLYQNEISYNSQFLLINSSQKIAGSKQQINTKELITQSQCQNFKQSQDEDYLHDIIRELRSENIALKNEITQLRLTITEYTRGNQKDHLEDKEYLKEDYMAFIPTQNSVIFEDRHSLASQILQLGMKLSEFKGNECFSYATKQEPVERTITQLELSTFNRSRSYHQITERSLVKSIILEDQNKNMSKETESKSGIPKLINFFMKWFVIDRIRTN